jgi:hypothetical protein
VAGEAANALGESITLGAAPAGSRTGIVAGKRVTTVERRGLSRDVLL